MFGQAPQGQRLEFAFGDQNRQRGVSERPFIDSRNDVQHVGSTRRAEVFLLCFQIADRIVFEIGLIAPQPVVADMA